MRHFKNIKNQKNTVFFRLLSIGLFLICLLLVGNFTIAFLTSKDEVSNTLHSENKSFEIELLEPAWYEYGSADAKKLVPGMTIAKDPYVINLSDTDVYFRIKIDILNSDNKLISAGDERYKMIMKLICLSGDDSTADLKEPHLYGANSINHLIEFENGEISKSFNQNFEYDDGWFYYVDASSNDLKIRKKGEATERLFEEIHVPILKKDYMNNDYNDESYDLFQKGFTIRIVAQALPATDLEEKDSQYIKGIFCDTNPSSYEIYKTSSDGNIN